MKRSEAEEYGSEMCGPVPSWINDADEDPVEGDTESVSDGD